MHGIIERIPRTHRYQVTGAGLRIALFFTRTYARLLRPKLAEIMAVGPPPSSQIRAVFDRVQVEIERACRDEKLAA
ncbi:MAG: hypothetical protein JNL98_09690 [Bryobacterales bacterium]|nr:hypothetical protein [Bryobacterales bacterium]